MRLYALACCKEECSVSHNTAGGYGGIGRRARFRFWWETVQVQVLLSAVNGAKLNFDGLGFAPFCASDGAKLNFDGSSFAQIYAFNGAKPNHTGSGLRAVFMCLCRNAAKPMRSRVKSRFYHLHEWGRGQYQRGFLC